MFRTLLTLSIFLPTMRAGRYPPPLPRESLAVPVYLALQGRAGTTPGMEGSLRDRSDVRSVEVESGNQQCSLRRSSPGKRPSV